MEPEANHPKTQSAEDRNNWSVYLLKCADNSLYCGVTNQFEKRLIRHNLGMASKYTRSRLPVECAAVRDNLTKRDAFRLEYRVKKAPRSKKIALLENWPLPAGQGGESRS